MNAQTPEPTALTESEIVLADWLRDWRSQECPHWVGQARLCCSVCLRDRILASDWLAARDAAWAERLTAVEQEAYRRALEDAYEVTTRVVAETLDEAEKRIRAEREKHEVLSSRPTLCHDVDLSILRALREEVSGR